MSAPRVLFVQHEESCPPGRFAGWLVEAGCEVEVWRPYDDQPRPSLAAYDGLVVLGGTMSATDPDVSWLVPVQHLIREADVREVVTLGICLGHQLAALAFGGSVAPNPRGQTLGLTEVVPTAGDSLLGAEPRPAVFWNDDVVTEVPEGAIAMALSAHGDVQALRLSPWVWSVQWHPETTPEILAAWAVGDGDRHVEQGVDQGAVLTAIEADRAELTVQDRGIAQRFADLVSRPRD